MTSERTPEAAGPGESRDPRWRLIRDVLVFQVKLGVDALRDLALSPISLFAALLDLLGSDRAEPYFYRVLATGRRSERWINLFGEADHVEAHAEREARRRRGIDGVVREVETLLREQYERGGVTAQAKAAIDRSLDALTPSRAPRPPRPGDDAR